jgi:hypothetical protein
VEVVPGARVRVRGGVTAGVDETRAGGARRAWTGGGRVRGGEGRTSRQRSWGRRVRISIASRAGRRPRGREARRAPVRRRVVPGVRRGVSHVPAGHAARVPVLIPVARGRHRAIRSGARSTGKTVKEPRASELTMIDHSRSRRAPIARGGARLSRAR